VIGTLVNALTVVGGSIAGVAVGRRLTARAEEAVFTVVGLFTAYLGLQMSLETRHPVSMVLGMLLGTLLGEYCDLNAWMNRVADHLRVRVGGGSRFVEGLVTAFLTYCIGPMTIIGSIEDGMGNHSIILAKAIMDGFVSIAYAASMGIGVAFSALPLVAFQGSLALLGSFAGYFIDAPLVSDLTGAGGLMLLALSLNLLALKKVRVANMLPSLITVPLLSLLLRL